MDPHELSEALKQIAQAVKVTKTPSKSAVAASLQRILFATGSMSINVTKMVSRDYNLSIDSLSRIIDKLESIAKTLNPQDQARVVIENAADNFKSLKSSLISEYKKLSKANI